MDLEAKMFPNLMKQKPGTLGSGQEWSLENLKDGLEYFYSTYGRYPTALEIDRFEYLPSSRAIQRTYGGLVKLRTELGLSGPTDFTKGETRSLVAGHAKKRSQNYEEAFYNYLISKIEEVRVHEQKILRPGNIQSDFYIYGNGGKGIAIDLFYSESIRNLASIVNIKLKRWALVCPETAVYFVTVENDRIFQEEIDKLVQNKKTPLPKNISVYTEITFKGMLDELINNLMG